MNGESTNRIPMATIRAADSFSSSPRCALSVYPIPVAVRPRAMKMAEKLATNRRLGPSTRRAGARSSSLGDTPVTADR
jgi:hypothetical protein